MSFSINEFSASLPNGLARSCNFDVTITPPRGMQTALPLHLKCKSAPDPGRTLAVHENRIYGPMRRMVHNQLFNDAVLIFYISPDRAEKKFFEQWQDVAVGPSRGLNGPRAGMFDLGFYDDYIGQVDIKTYDDNGRETYVCSLREAFPLAIQDMGLSWENDGFVELNVMFAFRLFVDAPGLYNNTPSPETETGTESST